MALHVPACCFYEKFSRCGWSVAYVRALIWHSVYFSSCKGLLARWPWNKRIPKLALSITSLTQVVLYTVHLSAPLLKRSSHSSVIHSSSSRTSSYPKPFLLFTIMTSFFSYPSCCLDTSWIFLIVTSSRLVFSTFWDYSFARGNLLCLFLFVTDSWISCTCHVITEGADRKVPSRVAVLFDKTWNVQKGTSIHYKSTGRICLYFLNWHCMLKKYFVWPVFIVCYF